MTLNSSNRVSLTLTSTNKSPLKIRHCKEIAGGNWSFEVHLRYNTGVIKTRGWKWITKLNRIYAPMLRGPSLHPTIILTPMALLQLRQSLRLTLEKKGVIVGEVGRRKSDGNKGESTPDRRAQGG